MKPTHAMILAAGLGLRMRPLTERMPKPLIPVAGRALIDYALDFVAAGNVSNVVVNTSYLAEQLEAHLNSTHVQISREKEPLETGGGIYKALPMLGDAPFFSLNSDAICVSGPEHPFSRLSAIWDDAAMDALLLLQPVKQASGYDGKGDFFVNEQGCIRRRGSEESAPYVFTGVQLMHPRLFKGAPGGAFSLNVLYNRDMAYDGTLARVYGLIHDGEWLHVGDAAGLRQADSYFQIAQKISTQQANA